MEVINDDLLRMERFFDLDLKVKTTLNNIMPNELDFYDEETMYKYQEKLFNGIKQIKNDIRKMMESYYVDKLENFEHSMDELLKKINSREFQILMARGYLSVLDFCNTYISNMRPEFVDSVNKSFIAFSSYSYNGVLIPNTINEYLHYTHSFVINNDFLYILIPDIIATDKDAYNGIHLRGKETELGKELFERILDFNIDSDCIDIINLDNKIVMMARGLGHATVIQIDTSDLENIFVKYFIPKNTNMEKARKLKGIKTCNSNFMVGDFMTNKDEFCNELCNFMNSIPTDYDKVITPNI